VSSKRKAVNPKKFRRVDMSVIFPKREFKKDVELAILDQRLRIAIPNAQERIRYIESVIKEME
jgi:hypothetical protein